ncbi:hypothetical protein [Geminocystis herdmanii]|uniref:hypothetical protein n=1 Tax=Geminocystis herdmanii TaxID=669359 RepID=UPI00034D9D86|nr:hypothetical protein [Geminocystis herdmanii]
MKEPKKEYWQDKASNMVIVFGGLIALLTPLLLNANLRGNFSTSNYNSSNNNTATNNNVKKQNLTKREVAKLHKDFEQQIKSVEADQYRKNYILDNRSQSEKDQRESFVSAWSKIEPELAHFLGEWSGYEVVLSIYPSTTKNKVCIINTGEGFGSFSTGTLSNGAIITNDGWAIITNQKYIATYGFENNQWIYYSGEVPLNSPMPLRSVNSVINDVYEVQEKNNIIGGFDANGCTLSTDRNIQSDVSNQNNITTIFDNESFPKDTCGDRMPTNINEFPVDFYPVYVNFSSENLRLVQSRFCKDAYSMTRKEIGQKAIQIGSFTSYDRAEQFSKFLKNKIGSGEVGQPRRVEKPPR